jgi:hypothetical protein
MKRLWPVAYAYKDLIKNHQNVVKIRFSIERTPNRGQTGNEAEMITATFQHCIVAFNLRNYEYIS